MTQEMYIDPVDVNPEEYRILVENDKVRVLEMIIKPGTTDALHSHPNMVVYFEKGGKALNDIQGMGAKEMEVPNGAALWLDAHSHKVTNLGSEEIKAIYFELKE